MLDTQAQYVVSTVLCLQPAHYAEPSYNHFLPYPLSSARHG